MNSDPVYQRLRETGWRRPLTAAEQAELRAWLATHPEAQAEVAADESLNAALAQLPAAPVPSNFSARVLQAIEREAAAAPAKQPAAAPWWRIFLPRLAVATLLVVGGTLFYHQQVLKQERELARAARTVATVEETFANPMVLADFEIIASLTPTAAAVDENLLALSEDLLALGK
jgi:anti-sigma factor RsiW